MITSVVISTVWMNNNTSRNGTGNFQSVTKCDNSDKITFTMRYWLLSENHFLKINITQVKFQFKQKWNSSLNLLTPSLLEMMQTYSYFLHEREQGITKF